MNVPLPFRVAAGVFAAGLDQLRRLPEELPGLPVAVVGSAVRVSLRVQQTVTELATRGDELLSSWANPPVENPPWARFDDEDDAGPPAAEETEPDSPTRESEVDAPLDAAAAAPESSAADPMAEAHESLTIGQLRARLRTLTIDQVETLLVRERSGLSRAVFLTALENRITSLRAATDTAPAPGRPDRR